jgi:hypothetical protein
MDSRQGCNPVVLVDGGDDGMDEQAWVEKIVSVEEALAILERDYHPDPDLAAIVAAGSRFFAVPATGREADKPWTRCGADHPRACDFWQFLAVDKADLDA